MRLARRWRPVSIVASRVPTSTVSPASTRISFTRPVAGEGTSVSTLSVEISTIGLVALDPVARALAPSVIVPSATETPIWGIVTSARPSQ